jgi:hypothetical protein
VQRDILPIVEGTTVNTKHGMVRTDHILFIAAGAFHVSKPSDLIPELQGRFPIRVELDALGRDEFVRILTEPQQRADQAVHGADEHRRRRRSSSRRRDRRIAELATVVNERTENIGARRLHTVMERLLDDVSFEGPDLGGRDVRIDAAYVDRMLQDIARSDDLSRYIPVSAAPREDPGLGPDRSGRAGAHGAGRGRRAASAAIRARRSGRFPAASPTWPRTASTTASSCASRCRPPISTAARRRRRRASTSSRRRPKPRRRCRAPPTSPTIRAICGGRSRSVLKRPSRQPRRTRRPRRVRAPAMRPRSSIGRWPTRRPARRRPAFVHYVVRGVAGSGRGRPGPFSAVVTVPVAALPAPPADVKATHDETTLKLTWEAGAAGEAFRVYSIPASAGRGAGAGRRHTRAAHFVAADRGGVHDPGRVRTGRCFLVRRVQVAGTVTVDSAPTAPYCYTAADTFPPPAPGGLQAVQEGTTVTLLWNPVEAPDMAGYLVLRRDGAATVFQPLTPAPIAAATFADATARAGSTYVYAVVAVDKSGNLSRSRTGRL